MMKNEMTQDQQFTASLETIQDDFARLEKEWENTNGSKEGFAEWFVSQMIK